MARSTPILAAHTAKSGNIADVASTASVADAVNAAFGTCAPDTGTVPGGRAGAGMEVAGSEGAGMGAGAAMSMRGHQLALLRRPGPLVLASVARIAGSTPREAGAFMLVGPDRVAGTIGGGNLEHQVISHIRQGFAAGDAVSGGVPDATSAATGSGDISIPVACDPSAPTVRASGLRADAVTMGGGVLRRFALGPGLGQCCGGSVEMAFHVLDDGAKHALADALIRAGGVNEGGDISVASPGNGQCWIGLPVGGDGAIAVFDGVSARPIADHFDGLRGGVAAFGGQPAMYLRLDDGATPLWLFGGGHVGQAIMTALAPLPFDIHLIDARDDYLAVPTGLTGASTPRSSQFDRPEDAVADMPAGAFALIMTHSHVQDFDICRAALARGDLGFVGMIGSLTKRARFIGRLRDRGMSEHAISRLTCPIGMPGIAGKHPAVIAASVAVQLLSIRDAMAGSVASGSERQAGKQAAK